MIASPAGEGLNSSGRLSSTASCLSLRALEIGKMGVGSGPAKMRTGGSCSGRPDEPLPPWILSGGWHHCGVWRATIRVTLALEIQGCNVCASASELPQLNEIQHLCSANPLRPVQPSCRQAASLPAAASWRWRCGRLPASYLVSAVSGWTKHPDWPWPRTRPWNDYDIDEMLRWRQQ